MNFNYFSKKMEGNWYLWKIKLIYSGGEPFVCQDFIDVIEAENLEDLMLVLYSYSDANLWQKQTDLGCTNFDWIVQIKNSQFFQAKASFDQ